MDTPSAPSQITIRPQSTAYDPSDERWLAQVQTLLQELRREVGPVQQVVTPLPGKKGGAVDLILALGSAGAFTVALTAFKAWLKRDKTRIVDIEITTPEGKTTIRFSGDNLSEAMFKQAFAAVVKK